MPTRETASERSRDAIHVVRCLTDNYAFLIPDEEPASATLIDAPEAAPILRVLAHLGLRLSRILLTHHHADHIQAVPELVAATGARVLGAVADAHRLPRLDHTFSPGDVLPGGIAVIDAPGHTRGHVAFYVPRLAAAFTGDSLMTHGCGRLFEGTPAEMFATISRLAALPPETRIFSGHDYARANLAFAARYAPDPTALAKRLAELDTCAAQGLPTTGTTLALESKLNPYLRVHLPEVAAAAGLPDAAPVEVFAAIRRAKDLA